MTEFILFFIGYFFLTLTLSKIAEKQEIDPDWLSGFLLLFPPLYFFYITRRVSIMAIVIWATYWITNLLIMYWIPLKIALIIFIIPFMLAFAYILHNLKADPKLNLINLSPPILWTFFLLWYLAFFYEKKEVTLEYLAKKNNENEKPWLEKNKNNKSSFNSLNKHIFKSLEDLNYNSINNEKYLWSNQ